MDLLVESIERFPNWLRLIATSRPDQSILARFRLPDVRHEHLDDHVVRNRDDLQKYVQSRLGDLGNVAQIDPARKPEERLVEKASGNFLFAKVVLDALAEPDYRLRPDEIEDLPRSLHGLYHKMFRRRFGVDIAGYEGKVLPFINCLVAARAPVPRRFLLVATGFDRREALWALRSVSPFLLESDSGVSWFHRSVTDWLLDDEASSEYVSDEASGHELLATAGWIEFTAGTGIMSDYSMAHLSFHLLQCGRVQELCTLLTSYDYLRSKLGRSGTTTLNQECDSLLNDTAVQGDTRKVVESIGGAIRLASTALSANASELPSQLLGRLGTVDAPPWIPRLCKRVMKWKGNWWLRPIKPNLISPGGPLERTLLGHTDYVTHLAPIPDSQLLVSGSEDGRLIVWDLMSGHSMRVLETSSTRITALSALPGSDRVIAGTADGIVYVWDVGTGQTLREFKFPSRIWDLCPLNSGGDQFVTASDDGSLSVCETASGRLLYRLEGHRGAVLITIVLPGGRQIVSGSADRTLKVWDLETGSMVHSMQTEDGAILCIELVRGKPHAWVGTSNGKIECWDFGTGKMLGSLPGHTDWVWALRLLPDGHRLLSGSEDRTIRLWDIDTRNLVRTLVGHSDAITAVEHVAGQDQVLSSSKDNTIRLWDLDSGKMLHTFRGHAAEVATICHLSGARAASASWDATVRVWNLNTTHKAVFSKAHEDDITALVVHGKGRVVSASWDGTVREWDLTSGEMLRQFGRHSGGVWGLAVSQDGTLLATAAEDGTRRVFELSTAALVGTPDEQESITIWDILLFLPDGRLLSQGADFKIRAWNPLTGETGKPLAGERDDKASSYLAFFVDENRDLLIGGAQDALRVLDLKSLDLMRESASEDGPIHAYEFFPERGTVVAATDATLIVWSLDTGERLRTIPIPEGDIVHLASLPGTALCMSGTVDGVLHVYDTQSGIEVLKFAGHLGSISAFGTFRERQLWISGSEDATVRVWSHNSRECIARITLDDPVSSLVADGDSIVIGTRTGQLHFLHLVDPNPRELSEMRTV